MNHTNPLQKLSRSSGEESMEIPLEDFDSIRELVVKRIAVASFETLKLKASQNDQYLCICVLYDVRKVREDIGTGTYYVQHSKSIDYTVLMKFSRFCSVRYTVYLRVLGPDKTMFLANELNPKSTDSLQYF